MTSRAKEDKFWYFNELRKKCNFSYESWTEPCDTTFKSSKWIWLFAKQHKFLHGYVSKDSHTGVLGARGEVVGHAQLDVKTDYTLLGHSKGVCKFSTGHSTWTYFIFLITGLVRPMLLIQRAHKHIFLWIFRLHARCKDWLYFAQAFQRCVQIFNRPLHLHVCYFPHHGTGTTHAVNTWGAQTHIYLNIQATCLM